jgi:hypothetical protein
MKSYLIYLAMGIFSFLSGKSQSKNTDKTEIFPPEKFAVVEATIGDKDVVGSFNMGYKKYTLKSKYPWCLKLAVALDLQNLFDNGLPKAEESAIANKLEDELVNEITQLATAHYVGHLFNDGFLDVYIYLDNPEKVHKFLQTQVDKKGLVRGFGYEITEDALWKQVQVFLK